MNAPIFFKTESEANAYVKSLMSFDKDLRFTIEREDDECIIAAIGICYAVREV